jgi:hypothetical protein
LRGDNAHGGGTDASWHQCRGRERAASRGGDAHGEGRRVRVLPCAVRGGRRHSRVGRRQETAMRPCRGGASRRGGATCQRGGEGQTQCAARPAIGAHSRHPAAAQGGGNRWRRRGIPVGLAGWYAPGSGSRGNSAWRRGWRRLYGRERAASRGGDARRGGVAHQGPTVRGEGRTSARLSWPTARDGDVPVSGRGVVSGRSGVS